MAAKTSKMISKFLDDQHINAMVKALKTVNKTQGREIFNITKDRTTVVVTVDTKKHEVLRAIKNSTNGRWITRLRENLFN